MYWTLAYLSNERAGRRRAGDAEPYHDSYHTHRTCRDQCQHVSKKDSSALELWLPGSPLVPLNSPCCSSSQSRSTSPDDILLDPVNAAFTIATQNSPTEISLPIIDPYYGSKAPLSPGRPESSEIRGDFAALLEQIHKAFSKNLFPLSGDSLLTLIHLNVYRALIRNVELLQIEPEAVCNIEPTTLLLVPGSMIPPSLLPTQAQMKVPHSRWIDILPSPQLRDNLISNIGHFNEEELCNDLVGEIFKSQDLETETLSEESKAWLSRKMMRARGDNLDLAADKSGFVVWNQPWDARSWEVTSGFLVKWGWAVEGCEDLLRSTNHWRASRNEEPLRFEELK